MKLVLIFLTTAGLLFFTSESLAGDKVVYVTGYGSASDFCSANTGYFCEDNVKRRAIDTAYRDSEYECRNHNGRLEYSTIGCYARCNPGYIPPDKDVWIHCDADCRLACYVPEGLEQ